ncbi:putative tail protein X [Pseudomonas phage PPpW-3]|uniref:Putative tail protein X n=1 Tax=Pseudomonas phage PPpW-3 TaxID=1279082 RepID=V5YTI6_9CAUD|nr:baseplate hub [Pseudomonas phage PPpW-3]BAO20623.1 putative tail protein X [Pseudomonas phage PPpW-3]
MAQYITSHGDTADYIAWKHYGTQDGRVVEQLVAANPGLADVGPVLPAGILLTLPVIKQAVSDKVVRLWD